jgi:hypothetical protein
MRRRIPLAGAYSQLGTPTAMTKRVGPWEGRETLPRSSHPSPRTASVTASRIRDRKPDR